MKNIKILIKIIYLISSTIFLGCESKQENLPKVDKVGVEKENNDPDCVEYVALWSAGEVAAKIGKDRKWVFLNYTVDVWKYETSSENNSKISKLRASSYAEIVEVTENDFKVIAPIDKKIGWINKSHVKSITDKNRVTKALCGD